MKKATAVAVMILAVVMLQVVPMISGAEEAKTQQCHKTAQNTLTCPKDGAACCKNAAKECCKQAGAEKCENCTAKTCANCQKQAEASCPKASKATADACPKKAACCKKAAAQIIETEESTVQEN